MSIKEGVFDIIGKTIKEVIINEDCTDYPDFHLFIVFDDSSAYEFYGGGKYLHSTNGLYRGMEYAKSFSCRKITRYYKDEQGKNRSENVMAE
jgi:hypothetical protein